MDLDVEVARRLGGELTWWLAAAHVANMRAAGESPAQRSHFIHGFAAYMAAVRALLRLQRDSGITNFAPFPRVQRKGVTAEIVRRREGSAPRLCTAAVQSSGLGRLKNGNPVGDFRLAPRCGAKTRGGGTCHQPAMANGRRRLHGGKSTGPRTAAGRARIEAANTRHGRFCNARRFERHSQREAVRALRAATRAVCALVSAPRGAQQNAKIAALPHAQRSACAQRAAGGHSAPWTGGSTRPPRSGCAPPWPP